MDVRRPQTEAPVVHEPAPETPDDAKDDKKSVKTPKVVVPKKPRQPGVTAAILASVVIVLGLAGLVVYAYLKSPH